MHGSGAIMGMMVGGWELLFIVGVLLLLAAGTAGVIFVALWLSRRKGTRRPPSSTASPSRVVICPRCGASLPADAPQGLCPRCVLQVGIETQDAAAPAFRDEKGKPNPPDPKVLARLFPQLEIIDLLGHGGMGAVYKARQKDLDRFVALKMLPGGAGGDPTFAERFSREARALARLSHPNIVAVHDFGQVGGFYYFIMEYIDGPNLRQLMQRQKLSPREAMGIVPRICEALQYAHDEGIVHRDIKPENILLDRKGRVKIADFGIAKIAGKRGDAMLTGDKDVIGTPHYMAPEQVERPTEVDHRADIYSLGVVFYEMLTGELPLGKFEVPSRKVQVDVRLDEVVLHALEKEPRRRYQRASEVKTDVETISSSEGNAVATGRSSSNTPAAQARRLRWFAPLMAVRGGRRVVHWPGVALDSFLLAGIYAISWLFAVLLLRPYVGTPNISALFGGMFGFVAGLLTIGFYRSSQTPMNRLRSLDPHSRVEEPRTGRWQPIVAALVLVACVLLWSFLGFTTYVLPMIVERAALQEEPLPVGARFVYHLGSIARHIAVVLVPLLILTTAGSLVWLFLSSSRLGSASGGSSEGRAATGPIVIKGMGLIAAQWTARILGTLLLVFYGIFIIAEGLPPIAAQSMGVQLNFIALGLMLGGFAVGWMREGTAAVLIASGWTLWHISEGRIDLNLFQTPLPVAALYAYCWWELRGRRTGLLLGTVATLAAALAIGRLILPVNVFLYGAVTDAAAGMALTNASLTIVQRKSIDRDSNELPNACTDERGRFRLHLGWWDARQLVRITAPGYTTLTTNLGPRAMGQRRVDRDFPMSLAPDRQAAAGEVLTFGPVREALLVSPKGRTAELFDLDSGVRMTSNVFGENDRETHAWIRRNKLDVLGVLEKGQMAILCNDMEVLPVESTLWATVTPEQVLTNWNLAQQEPKPVVGIAPATDHTDTYLFQTREGGQGALKIVGKNDQPPGVNIRYRLIQHAEQERMSIHAALQTKLPIPPVVIHTIPQSGAKAVDPSIPELRVTFSKPMQDGNWSWVQLDDETFPKMTGEPHFLNDDRTCVLPVKLEPGRVYATWINVDAFTNFQDGDGQPSLPYLLIFETRK